MRLKLILSVFVVALTTLFKSYAQSEENAKRFIASAEKHLSEKRFLPAITDAESAESALGKPNVRTLYLKISAGKEHALADAAFKDKTYRWIDEYLNMTTIYKVEPEKLKEVTELKKSLPNLYALKEKEIVADLVRKWTYAPIPTGVQFNELPKDIRKKLMGEDFAMESEGMVTIDGKLINYNEKSYGVKDIGVSCKTGVESISVLGNGIVCGYTYTLFCGKNEAQGEQAMKAEVEKLKAFFGEQNIETTLLLDEPITSVKPNDAKYISIGTDNDMEPGKVTIRVIDYDVIRKYVKAD